MLLNIFLSIKFSWNAENWETIAKFEKLMITDALNLSGLSISCWWATILRSAYTNLTLSQFVFVIYFFSDVPPYNYPLLCVGLSLKILVQSVIATWQKYE